MGCRAGSDACRGRWRRGSHHGRAECSTKPVLILASPSVSAQTQASTQGSRSSRPRPDTPLIVRRCSACWPCLWVAGAAGSRCPSTVRAEGWRFRPTHGSGDAPGSTRNGNPCRRRWATMAGPRPCRLPSPLPQALFTLKLGNCRPGFLADHQLGGRCIAPLALLLTTLREVAGSLHLASAAVAQDYVSRPP